LRGKKKKKKEKERKEKEKKPTKTTQETREETEMQNRTRGPANWMGGWGGGKREVKLEILVQFENPRISRFLFQCALSLVLHSCTIQ
jgi:hypothetical protein